MNDAITAPVSANEPAPTALPAAPAATAPIGGPLEDQPVAAATEGDDNRYVPLPALHQAREEVRHLKEQLAAANAKTSEVDTLRQQIQELSARIPQTPPPETPQAPLLADDAADSLARTLQLFDATGAPDRTAARNAAGIMAAMASKEAKQAVAPIIEMSAKERAQQFRQRAEQVRDLEGKGVDPTLLRQMWAVVPDELIGANPQVPALLTYAAAGFERIHGQRGVAPAVTPPIVSERAGGRVESQPTLSDFELGHLQRSGRDPKAYVASLKGYKPGLPTTLE